MINLGGHSSFRRWTTRKFDVSVACIVDVFVAREAWRFWQPACHFEVAKRCGLERVRKSLKGTLAR